MRFGIIIFFIFFQKKHLTIKKLAVYLHRSNID